MRQLEVRFIAGPWHQSHGVSIPAEIGMTAQQAAAAAHRLGRGLAMFASNVTSAKVIERVHSDGSSWEREVTVYALPPLATNEGDARLNDPMWWSTTAP